MNFTLSPPGSGGPNDNTFGGHTSTIVQLQDGDGLDLSNWDFTLLGANPATQVPLYIASCRNSTFTGNTISGYLYAIQLDGNNTDNTISDNDLSGSASYGLYFRNGINNGNIITNNNLTNSNGWAVHYNYGTPNTISDNDFTGSRNGLLLARAVDFTLGANTYVETASIGIQLDSSTRVTIPGTNTSASGGTGIYVSNSRESVIDDNSSCGWDIGIRISGSSNQIANTRILNSRFATGNVGIQVDQYAKDTVIDGIDFNSNTTNITDNGINTVVTNTQVVANATWCPSTNEPPVADAGDYQPIECATSSGAQVMLDGSGSSDPDADPLTYLWTALGITFDDPTSVTPTATFPVGTTTVTLTVDDGNGGTDTDDVVITVVADTEPPVITLVGADPQILECSIDAYTELGATAADACDGDLTANMVTDASAVDVSTPGSYAVTYDVSDAAGNAAVQVTRTVTVVDTIPPVITLVGADPQILECSINVYSELGATALDACDGDLTASIVIDASAVDGDVPGSYDVTYNVVDASGNAASLTRTVTIEDTTSPTIFAALEDVLGNGKSSKSNKSTKSTKSTKDDDDDDDDGDDDGKGKGKGKNDSNDNDKGDKGKSKKRAGKLARVADDDEDDDGGVHFRVDLSAEDNCDCCGLDITAYIAQPLTASDPFELRYKPDRKKIEIKVERTKKRLRVTLSGPDEGTLLSFWEDALTRGGFLVHNDQIVKLVATGRKDYDDDAKGSLKFRFDLDYNLLDARLPMPTMVAYAVDTSGNQSDIVEVMPPYSWLGHAKPVAPPSDLSEGQAINYPNPFNATTQIGYWLPEEGDVTLAIYNMAGQLVRVLERDFQMRGYHQMEWDGRNESGWDVSTGIYLYRVVNQGFVRRHVEVGRMLLLR